MLSKKKIVIFAYGFMGKYTYESFLKDKNIPTAIYYPIPMHQQPAYKKYHNKSISLSISEELSKTVFSIPIHPYLEKNQIIYIINSLKDAVKYVQ